MAIQGGIELLVTPERLNQKAGEVEKHVVQKSKGYWIGDAGNMHRQNYSEQQDNIEQVLRRLGEHPGDLRAIAQTYTATELKIEEEIVHSLPGNIL